MIADNEQDEGLVYHVTCKDNLPSIRANGLIPQIGPRATLMKEQVTAVYLFPTRDDVENAMMNWLGDQLVEAEIVILALRVPEHIMVICDGVVDYEWSVGEAIPPSAIVEVFDETWMPESFGPTASVEYGVVSETGIDPSLLPHGLGLRR